MYLYAVAKNIPEFIKYYHVIGDEALETEYNFVEETNILYVKTPDDYNSLPKIQEGLLDLAKNLGLKNGQLLWPLRVSLSGEQFSPGVFEIIQALGKDETLKRIENTLATRTSKASSPTPN